jgi:septal ring factor EnvC (AmiA/AmiB activator)
MAPASPVSSAISKLQAALAAETSRRIAAEKMFKNLETESEDLSLTLSEQANEMVAMEGKEKAKLETRLKVLKERDTSRQKRLEMVEAALTRMERVKKLLDG